MFEWLYYNGEEKDYAEKTMIFLLDKKIRIATDPDVSDNDRKIKCDRLNFLMDCIKYKFSIMKNV